jgi:hypothetical protein
MALPDEKDLPEIAIQLQRAIRALKQADSLDPQAIRNHLYETARLACGAALLSIVPGADVDVDAGEDG